MLHRWIGPALVATLLALAGAAAAMPADKHLVVEADNGAGCAEEGKSDCFRVVEGSLDGFEQGMRVHVLLENVGSAPHNIFVTEQANADANNADTPADAAINGSETIDEGETANLTFTVPDDAEGLYFWCDVDTHEALGMWMQTSVAEASEPPNDDPGGAGDGNASDGGTADGGSDASKLVPSAGAIVATSAGLLATFGRRKVGS